MLDPTKLDKIINEIIEHIKESQKIIYDIIEHTRTEYENIKHELDEIQKVVVTLVNKVDTMVIKDKEARYHLMKVNRDFSRYSQDDIKLAYEKAQKLQLELANLRGQESLLRYKRDNLERSLRRLQDMLNKAENTMSHLGVVFSYLTENLTSISSKVDEMNQIKSFGIRIIKAQEEERKRIAREIHDGPAQVLANIVMRTEYILKLMQVKPENVREELTNLQELVKQSLQEVRKIIFDLRPMVLDDLGLVPALNQHIEDYKNKYQINANFVFFGTQQRLSPVTEVALFRVVQEALNNVYKHAGAQSVLVKMEQLSNKITIHIKDDGKGFDLQSVEGNKERECYGLINMRERIQLLKGDFIIYSEQGKGTVLTLTVPI